MGQVKIDIIGASNIGLHVSLRFTVTGNFSLINVRYKIGFS